MSNVGWTVRYPSGTVEFRYGEEPPKVGEIVGRNGDEGFVVSVAVDDRGVTTVVVGTHAPAGMTWDDVGGVPGSAARHRILEAADELFARRGIRAVGIDELTVEANVSKATLYRHFASKEEIVLAFLQRREQQWTREFVEEEARRRGSTPRERLLAIFDVFDEWFHRDDFEGCSFVNVLLETPERTSAVRAASAAHLEYIRSVVGRLAVEAGMTEEAGAEFAHTWHILMKGSIVSAGEGDVLAARRARSVGVLVLDRFLETDADPLPQSAGRAEG